ncbi:class I SAM-dependent DNA methyltransferase [Polynucleobacter sp. MWH-HuK1]|uniref:type I restriction-modification system subunit M n=1 Tax=Polynucleobacter sp. MWH-HuK1 TaxID=1743158 RepID=UPI001C0B861D|nr:class I SAM-dependent DNA methyltransferase [Polynucleobacter sp. MWH-HuK1]MBU3566382.1 SAM-dependent DNA methyltransferase [Polynucleobacter sp. MWH-HuK1]
MALKKSELYSSLWESCNELRGGMDASQYKDYVLVMLFIKYVSDKYAGKSYAPITIPFGASFSDMVELKGKSDIGDQINKKILAPLSEANNLSDMPDFNDPTKLGDGKEKVDRLTNLIAIFENPALDFSQNRADGDDLLGDAYEYLMRHFATESGKSKGQFYTPAEVSRVMAQVLDIRNAKTSSETTVYDPACGSGSLLLKVGDEAQNSGGVKVTLYGQEKDNTTAGLSRMNMILHDYPTAEIKQGNTLANPLFLDGAELKTFDYVVANPPFSDKRWSTGFVPESDQFGRFDGYGIPPSKQGDFAYLLHILRSIKSNGKGACILPHGVLFRGNAEAVIRKNLIQRGLIEGIIGLPANLFYGTGIPACIILLNKAGASSRKAIFMINASEGFRKDGPKNRLRDQDIHRIVDTYHRMEDVYAYARMVPISEISDSKNDFNLNLPRYIESGNLEDIQNVSGHLYGGIPDEDIRALNQYWNIFPNLRNSLFEEVRPGFSKLRVPVAEIKPTIFNHPEFVNFHDKIIESFERWKNESWGLLENFDRGSNPKKLIEGLSETLLDSFKNISLFDCYFVFQSLMDYWSSEMQDDIYLIAADGWIANTKRIIEVDKKGKQKDKGWSCDLVPKDLVINHYFKKEKELLDGAIAKLEAVVDSINELEEEYGDEDGYFGSFEKISKSEVGNRLKEIAGEDDSEEEVSVLKQWLDLFEEESKWKKKVRECDVELDLLSYKKYEELSELDIKNLVINDKWMSHLLSEVLIELDGSSQKLTSRLRDLSERYAQPLPNIIVEIEKISEKVKQHLNRMNGC